MSPPPPPGAESFSSAFWRTFVNVGVAEIFDKTWFMALFLAVRGSKVACFVGSFGALAVHTFLAAAIGAALASLPGESIGYVQLCAAGLFFLFAILYAYESYAADPTADVLSEGKAEGADDEVKMYCKQCPPEITIAIAAFVAVFIAEWGDRTQLVLLALHATLPLWPVVLASLVAFALLTLSAVMLAAGVDWLKLSKRLACALVSLSFVVFAVLFVFDGIDTLAAPPTTLGNASLVVPVR